MARCFLIKLHSTGTYCVGQGNGRLLRASMARPFPPGLHLAVLATSARQTDGDCRSRSPTCYNGAVQSSWVPPGDGFCPRHTVISGQGSAMASTLGRIHQSLDSVYPAWTTGQVLADQWVWDNVRDETVFAALASISVACRLHIVKGAMNKGQLTDPDAWLHVCVGNQLSKNMGKGKAQHKCTGHHVRLPSHRCQQAIFSHRVGRHSSRAKGSVLRPAWRASSPTCCMHAASSGRGHVEHA